MRCLITRSFVYRFPSLLMMPKGDGQRKARTERSLPVHRTFLGAAEAMGPAVIVAMMKRHEVPQRGDRYSSEGGGGGGGDGDSEW